MATILDKTKSHAWLVTNKGILALEETEEGLTPVGTGTLEQLSQFLQKTGYRSPRLPMGCIGTGYSSHNSGKIEYFIYELNSGPYALKYDDHNRHTTFEVSLPYMYFIVGLTKYKDKPIVNFSNLLGSNTPIENFDSEMYHIPIPNVDNHDGRVCWGSNPLIAKDGESASDFGVRLLKHFFDTKFNNHLWPIHDHAYRDWTDWQEKTKKNPKFMESIKLLPAPYTINQILTRYGVL